MRMQTAIGLSLALLIGSATAWAKQAHATHHHSPLGAKSKHAKTAPFGAKRRPAAGKAAVAAAAPADRRQRAPAHQDVAVLPAPDRYIGPLRTIGPRQIGTAAWYGGRLIGERTASGELLDTVHATAAHRSLPLHSLVRVTNLRNGRSAIATINDRGPVSRSLLIDVSPRVAEELDMKRTGIAAVTIEPIAEAAMSPR
jgi:rare lipoprotein A